MQRPIIATDSRKTILGRVNVEGKHSDQAQREKLIEIKGEHGETAL